MDIRIYDPPLPETPAFRTAGRVTGAVAVTAVERLYTPGYFEIKIPTEARHAGQLTEGRLVWIGRGLWGIVDEVRFAADAAGAFLTVSGRQLKGLTSDRVTIPPAFNAVTGAQGYDTVTGSTETCMKHFAAANLCNAAQPTRAVWGLEIAEDLGRGLSEDRYMSRHDVLSDVLAALGEAAGLGYDITPDLARHALVFDVVAGADHTALQSDRTRVIFDLARKTALSQTYQHSGADSRNVFYTTMEGAEFADEALTVTYLRDGETEARGIYRRETHLSISGETPAAGEEYNELRRKALIEAEGYRPAESFECQIAPGPYQYRRDYRLGDLVTVRNGQWGVLMHTRVTEMQTVWDGAGVKYTATFGTPALNVFGRLKRQIGKRR